MHLIRTERKTAPALTSCSSRAKSARVIPELRTLDANSTLGAMEDTSPRIATNRKSIADLVHLIDEGPHTFTESRIVVSSRALRRVARWDG